MLVKRKKKRSLYRQTKLKKHLILLTILHFPDIIKKKSIRLNIFLRVISLTPSKMVSSLERVMDKTNKLSIICILEPCLNSEDNLV